MQNEIPLPYYFSTTRNHEKSTHVIFTNAKCRRITTDDYEFIPHGWIIYTIKQAIDGVHWHRS